MEKESGSKSGGGSKYAEYFRGFARTRVYFPLCGGLCCSATVSVVIFQQKTCKKKQKAQKSKHYILLTELYCFVLVLEACVILSGVS